MDFGVTNLKTVRAGRLLLCAALLASGLAAQAAPGQGADASTVAAASPLQAEQTVRGTVTDEAGEPLIGVNVVERGTGKGTITDLDGNYVLQVSGDDAVLEFTYVGYTTITTRVGGRPEVNVTMGEDTQSLDEVVVTALGIKREKKMLGYAVQDVKGDKLNMTGDPSVTSALAGKVAGLQMSTASTGLSGSTKITLRGNSSLTDNNQPLWVVDGVPFSDNSDSGASLFGGIDRGGSAIDINPDDIESISVLKGPNAAALYGSRAGNGVILITTKKGVKDKGFGVTYSGNFTWTDVASSLDQQTTYGQGTSLGTGSNVGQYNPSSFEAFGAPMDGRMVDSWLDGGQQYAYRDYGDKFKEYFNTGFAQTHNVAIGKTTDTSHFRTSLGYMDSKGLFDGETLNKINLDLKGGMKMNKFLSMDAKVSLSRTKAENRPQFGKGGAHQRLTVGLGQPDMEFLHAEQLDDVGVGRDVEQAGCDHVPPGGEIGAVMLFACLLRDVPVFELVVKAPGAEIVYAAEAVVEVVRGGGSPHKGFLRVQPVEFHAEEHLTAGGIRFGLGLEGRHFAHVILHMRFELLAVFVAVGVALRAGRVFAEAVETQTGGFGGGVHLRRGVAAVGIEGMGVQIPQDHGLSLWFRSMPGEGEGCLAPGWRAPQPVARREKKRERETLRPVPRASRLP